jgi:hypothetical protein
VRGEPGVGEPDQQRRHGPALGGQPLDPCLRDQPRADLDRSHREDRWSADAEPLDPRRRVVDRAHGELVALAEPALDR